MRLPSEAAARFDLYIELLCLEAVDRVVVEYFDVSVGWVQQQQQQLELEQQQPEQQQQLEQQQQQRQERFLIWCRCALQRRFLLEQATATAVEQARKRDREPGAAGGAAGGGSKATTERARPEAAGGGPRRSLVLFGAVLRSWEWRVACWRIEKRKNGPLSGV